MSKRIATTAAVLALAAFLAGCATRPSQSTMNASSTMSVGHAYSGRIVSEKPVRLQGQPSTLSKLAGFGLGFLVGRKLAGSTLGGAVGGIAGYNAGGYVAAKAGEGNGELYVIRLSDGQLATIAEPMAKTDKAIPVGTVVYVLKNGDGVRLMPQGRPSHE